MSIANLIMIELYVKFNVHFNKAKQVTVLKVADRKTDASTKIWLRPEKTVSYKKITH